ncbi:sensor histidine kinase KdpD [Cohnella sp. AR92]|uniref:sensor histidine kinase n=1 Tax=Cohnella sp. AR92 TaxID=648716 RepID=UPI000F8F435E|nr:HAMP domain-containing sensor histidine kinase [Cohnella sp. AR92]RUS43289.1 HAMP domain-containing histidine kinase [Cohnella sp. AR92]
MKQRSFFRRYLVVHFLGLALLPVMILMMVAGVNPSSDPSSMDTTRSISGLIALIIATFISVSGVFFYRLRQRLVRLQKAMTVPGEGSWIPEPIPERASGMNEVDQLGASFNQMIRKLRDSRLREQEEESLRKQLIANLSHDLRTPLTALRGHASRLHREPLSQEGVASLTAIDHTITHISELMDDLLSYTLLTAGKYPYHPEPTDMVRLLRSSVASWYPAFENAGFRIDADLPFDATFSWDIDSQWMTRVLGNLFQNVLRHADDGRFIGIAVDIGQERFIIQDHGPGMGTQSANRGAGMGLTISKYMLKEMGLQVHFSSDAEGTTVRIGKKLDQT